MSADPSIPCSDRTDPSNDDRICDQCGYPLKGLNTGAACPECGTQGSSHEPAILQGGLPEPVQAIQQCGECGYPLKGLPSIGTCPECGYRYKPGNSRRRQINLITPSVLVSTSFRMGLSLLIAAIVSALFMQIVVLFYRISPDDYWLVMTMSSSIWALGLCLVITRGVAGQNRFLGLVRLLTLASQWIWPLAFILSRQVSMSKGGAPGILLEMGILIGDVTAAIGLFSSLCFLGMICRDLYLRRQASRMELAALLFPFCALGIWIFPYPADVTQGVFKFEFGVRTTIYMIVLSPWWALFVMVGLGIKDVFVRSIWESRFQQTHDGRIASDTSGDAISGFDASSVDATARESDSGDIELSRSSDPAHD